MTSRYEASINGKNLSSVNKNLLILDISCPSPSFSQKKRQIANLDGYDLSATYLEKQEVTITFELHIYDIAKRYEACRAVQNWAKSGTQLKISDRKDQYLEVTCIKFPTIESSKKWTDPLTVTFTTIGIPYWQAAKTNTRTFSNTKNSSGSLTASGNYSKALVSVDITAKEKLTAVKVTVGSQYINIKNINIPKNKKITITYTNGRFLKVLGNGSSLLSKITEDSSDNLKMSCGGTAVVKISANDKCTAVFSVRGLYL